VVSDKFMGDGILIYFGYPQAHEDDAERAVRAGLELVAAVSDLRTHAALQTRIGIATGLVVVGNLIGSGASQEQAIVAGQDGATLLHWYPLCGKQRRGNPGAALIADSKGNLFGTTECGGASGVGTVFELSPPATAGGAWTETVRSSFNYGDGAGPFAGLIADSNGNLYGTTSQGGVSCPDVGCGTVFELTDIGSPPTPPRICAICRSPPICCACAGGGGSCKRHGRRPQWLFHSLRRQQQAPAFSF
jgi:uncharacterized repeat protein (TIGR03803 family)